MKTALVLSAGGMFGAYQAGVWSELESLFEPDLVVGASIGSLNGWFIAGGVPASELVNRWLDLQDASDHKFRVPPYLSDGLLKGDMVENWIHAVFSAARPVREYALVTTELATMRPRVFSWPDLEWTHLAASCAVPVVLKQQRICGAWHGDGGLLDPLPLWAALELGATRIITVNVLVNRPLVVRAAARLAAIRGGYRRPDAAGVEHLAIEPSRSLGSLRDAVYWSRAKAEELVELGREDGRRTALRCPWLSGSAAA